jgi:hypothetical protein
MGLWGATAAQMSPHPAYRRGLAAQLWRVMQLCWLVCTVSLMQNSETSSAIMSPTCEDGNS